jgi:hypothetical protein
MYGQILSKQNRTDTNKQKQSNRPITVTVLYRSQ